MLAPWQYFTKQFVTSLGSTWLLSQPLPLSDALAESINWDRLSAVTDICLTPTVAICLSSFAKFSLDSSAAELIDRLGCCGDRGVGCGLWPHVKDRSCFCCSGFARQQVRNMYSGLFCWVDHLVAPKRCNAFPQELWHGSSYNTTFELPLKLF